MWEAPTTTTIAPINLSTTTGMDDGSDETARKAVQTFVRILGAVAGDLSLIHLPFGGVYLVGGVARAVSAHFSEFEFESSFRDKGRFAGFMQNFGVSVITDDFAALTGCASYLHRLIQSRSPASAT